MNMFRILILQLWKKLLLKILSFLVLQIYIFAHKILGVNIFFFLLFVIVQEALT